MTREEAILYLQPIADSASLPRYAEALNMAIAALKEQENLESKLRVFESSGWISVEDRLPKEWEDVLVWSKCGFVACAFYIGIPDKWRVSWNHETLEPDTITHWMPLPEPPEVPEQ